MRTSIATVLLGGSLTEKLSTGAASGFWLTCSVSFLQFSGETLG
ncbi:MAG: hypothetical protein ACJA1L_001206 [Paracoccaceae bacterium]|jgi:hypothetical protein